jgi:hypothetical protein
VSSHSAGAWKVRRSRFPKAVNVCGLAVWTCQLLRRHAILHFSLLVCIPLSGVGCHSAVTPRAHATMFDDVSSPDYLKAGVIDIRTTVFPPSPSGYSDYEPMIMADPDAVEHVVVSDMRKMFPAGDPVLKHTLETTRAWWSLDGGRSWDAPQEILRDVFPGREMLNGDPTLAVSPDGRFHLVILAAEYTATDITAFVGLIVASQGEPASVFSRFTKITLTDVPRSWQSPGHVPALTVDRWPSSPHHGRMYLTYCPPLGEGGPRMSDWNVREGWALLLKTSDDGGRTFTKATEIPHSRAPFEVQAAKTVVRPDGSLHMVWSKTDTAEIMYSVSRDGGQRFDDPVSIYHGQPSHVTADTRTGKEERWELQWPQIAIGQRGVLRGTMVAAWNEGYLPKEEPGHPTEEVFVTVNTDGEHWSKPVPLDTTLGVGRKLSYPQVAVTEHALWVLAYRSDSEKTALVLYRSVDRGQQWERAAVIAERGFGAQYISSSTLVYASVDDGMRVRFRPGDYIGLSAAGNRLYAAYTLPAGSDPAQPARLYVSTIHVD